MGYHFNGRIKEIRSYYGALIICIWFYDGTRERQRESVRWILSVDCTVRPRSERLGMKI